MVLIAMRKSCKIFGVILWKNLLIRRRHKFLTLLEITIPILFFLLVSFARSKIPDFGKQYVNESTTVDPIYLEDLYTRINIHDLKVFYAPKTDFTRKLIRQVQLKLSLYNEGIRGFSSEKELMAYYNKHGEQSVTAGILFNNVGNTAPEHLSYDIRMYEEHVFWSTDQLFPSISEYVPGIGSEVYKDKGFLPLQTALDISFLEMVAKDRPQLSLIFQEFPYPPYIKDSGLRPMFIHALPILTLFSFLFLWPAILKRVIEEKCSGIKELMKLNGLDSWMLWSSWFLHGFVLNVISSIAIVLLLKLRVWNVSYPVIEHCNAIVLTLFLILYCSASISFCLMVSTLFKKPNVAMVVGILFWIISYLVYSNVSEKMDVLTWCLKLLALLLPNISLHYGYQAISKFELREIHLGFSNLFESPTGSSDDISMGNIFMMLIFDTVFYFVLCLYLDNLFPGPYGIQKEWNYLLKNVQIVMRRRNSVRHEEVEAKPAINEFCVPKIKIRGLHKVYAAHKTAVNELTMDLYEGQITGLLGHNGAGKTTTISILTGMIDATSGDVFINDGKNGDVNLKQNFSSIRHLISVCPQHNLTFPDLTVLEHLKFFGMLRGRSFQDAHHEAVELLNNKLHLLDKKNKLVHTLSGGMKRKLAFGMALMGDPEILILDEPTSGVDIEGRRELWDLIQSYRKSKTIIITTHFMEEADYLADLIAIMDHGNLLEYDTPMKLKEKFNVGYYLTLNIVGGISEETRKYLEETIGVKKVKECNMSANKVMYQYHMPNDKKSEFTKMMYELEETRSSHVPGSFSFRVSHTTLEDVFLKVGEMAEAKCKETNDTTNTNSSGPDTNKRTEPNLWRKILTLFEKRWLYMKRKFMLYIFMFLAATFDIFLVFNLGGNGSLDATKDGPTLYLDLSVYGETGVYYSTTGNNADEINRHYRQLITRLHSVPMRVDNVENEIIEKGIENIAYYKQRIIAGAKFNFENDVQQVEVMFSNKALHGAPISLNLVTNTLLKTSAGEQYSISASNTPLHSVNNLQTKLEQSGITNLVMWFVLFPLAPLFIVSYIISFTHAEESSSIRRLQHICGVPPWLYWLSNLFWDFVFYLATMLVSLTVLHLVALTLNACGVNIFGNYLLFELAEFGIIIFILTVYACSIPFAYWTSYFSKTVEAAYSTYLFFNISIFPILTAVVLVMEFSGDDYYTAKSNKLRWIFAISPQFALTYMSSKFSKKFIDNHNWAIKSKTEKDLLCNQDFYLPAMSLYPCCDPSSDKCANQQSYFNELKFLWVTLASSILFLLLLIFADKLRSYFKNTVLHFCDCIWNDTDTLSENNSVQMKSIGASSSPANDENKSNVLTVDGIWQKYLVFPNWKSIVKNLSFSVKKGECFGLLGVNGAGKSTTFRILANQELPSHGHVNKTIKNMGYCPQQDALINELTGKELLTIFAKLRGCESPESYANKWFCAMGMKKYIDQPCGTYSGGNKRKLNTLLSIIGLPPLIMLDEPTSGVDPTSRRILWNTLIQIKAQAKSALILSSHSMDECEALCDKLIIMKDGRSEEDGTIPELKEKEKGFTVKIKLKSDSQCLPIDNGDVADCIVESEVETKKKLKTMAEHYENNESVPLTSKTMETKESDDDRKRRSVAEDLLDKIKNADIVDEHRGMLHVRVKETNWSKLFEEMENLTDMRKDIEDYSISETSLEDLFLKTAREQDSQERKKHKSESVPEENKHPTV